MQPLPGHTAWRTEQGLDFNLLLPRLSGCPYAVNNLHGPRVSFRVLMGGTARSVLGMDGCTAPSLADMPIADGVCLRAKLPSTAAGVHLLVYGVHTTQL